MIINSMKLVLKNGFVMGGFCRCVMFIFALSLLSVLDLYSQQEKVFTQYLNYPSVINPAYVGSRESVQFLGVVRRQWSGIDGAPESAVFSVNAPINFYSLGVAFNMESDKWGPEKSNKYSADISYSLQLSRKTHLSLGIKTSVSRYEANLNDSRIVDKGDVWLEGNINSQWLPQFGLGAYLYSQRYFVGISVPRAVSSKVEIDSYSDTKHIYENSPSDIYFLAGCLLDINPVIKLKPTCLICKTNGAPVGYDITGMLIFYERLWFGLSYRREDAAAVIVQYNLDNNLKVGLAYDYGISGLSKKSDGSCEISVSYDLNLKSRKLRSPRYF